MFECLLDMTCWWPLNGGNIIVNLLFSTDLTGDQRQTLETQLQALSDDISNLTITARQRREQLIQNCNFHKLIADLEEEESWLSNQIQAMNNKDAGHDFSSVLRLIRRHEVDDHFLRFLSIYTIIVRFTNRKSAPIW